MALGPSFETDRTVLLRMKKVFAKRLSIHQSNKHVESTE